MTTDEREPSYAGLDPAADMERWEALLERVMARARPEIERRAAAGGPGRWIADWARPAIAAAAVLAALATGGLLSVTSRPIRDVEPAGVGAAIGWPAPVEMWAETGRRPYLEEMLIAMEVIE